MASADAPVVRRESSDDPGLRGVTGRSFGQTAEQREPVHADECSELAGLPEAAVVLLGHGPVR